MALPTVNPFAGLTPDLLRQRGTGLETLYQGAIMNQLLGQIADPYTQATTAQYLSRLMPSTFGAYANVPLGTPGDPGEAMRRLTQPGYLQNLVSAINPAQILQGLPAEWATFRAPSEFGQAVRALRPDVWARMQSIDESQSDRNKAFQAKEQIKNALLWGANKDPRFARFANPAGAVEQQTAFENVSGGLDWMRRYLQAAMPALTGTGRESATRAQQQLAFEGMKTLEEEAAGSPYGKGFLEFTRNLVNPAIGRAQPGMGIVGTQRPANVPAWQEVSRRGVIRNVGAV